MPISVQKRSCVWTREVDHILPSPQAPLTAACASRAPPGHTQAPQVRGSACSRKSAFVADTCVILRMGDANTRNMSEHEPHEGSGRHLQSTAVRDHGRHVMRDLRDHDTLQQIDITTTFEHKGQVMVSAI